MMKINYQKKLDKFLEKLDYKPSLLLHSCCAPCSSYVLEYLVKYFDITVFFCNPNMIHEEEFEKRHQEQVKINEIINKDIKLVKVSYNPSEFYEAIKGYEHIPEGGERCTKCFDLRLSHAAEYAKKNNFDYFTTTLSISPHKNAMLLNTLGVEIGSRYGVNYLESDFKKKNGYKRSVELSLENNIYRQDYCGCVFSKEERGV